MKQANNNTVNSQTKIKNNTSKVNTNKKKTQIYIQVTRTKSKLGKQHNRKQVNVKNKNM